jgi:hypothetical protein
MKREMGQVAPLVAVMVVAAGFLCLVVVRFGVAAAQRADARTAADAAALAGAAAGRGAADELASANGGHVIRYETEGRDVTLRLERADAAATAKATKDGDGEPKGAAPALRAVLARAAQLMGRDVPVVAVLDGGLAVEVEREAVDQLHEIGPDAGLCHPSPDSRPTYFDVCPAPDAGSDPLR